MFKFFQPESFYDDSPILEFNENFFELLINKEENDSIIKNIKIIDEDSNNNENENKNKTEENKKIFYIDKTIVTLNNPQFEKEGKNRKGRKIKNSKEYSAHNKFSDDNLIRRIKGVVLGNFRKYINDMINKFNINIKYRLLINKHDQILKVNVNYNKEFIHKKLKDIFSDQISTKCVKHTKDHNQKLIQLLLNHEDINIRNTFEKIFNLTFLDCLKIFRNEILIDEFEGLKRINEFCNYLRCDNDEDTELYIRKFIYFVSNYEIIINYKKPRNSRKKKSFGLNDKKNKQIN